MSPAPAPPTPGDLVLKAAEQHYRKAAGLLDWIEVPEWTEPDGTPVRLYFRGAIAAGDWIGDSFKDREADPELRPFLFLIRYALDSTGARLWQEGHIAALQELASGTVIQRLMLEMQAKMERGPDLSTAMGNSETTPSPTLASV